MTEPFGEGAAAEVFRYSLFLVLCNRLCSCAVAVFGLVVSSICLSPSCCKAQSKRNRSLKQYLISQTNGKLNEIYPVAPLWSYAAVSVSNVVATFCQYEALKYVSFPVQTLGKCAKMLPVMIWGIFILRKKYTAKDFLIALAVTGGCTLFLLTGEVHSKTSKGDHQSSMYGLLLMLGYLGFDGFTSTFQDKLFKGYNMTTYNQILYTTMWSSLFSLFGESCKRTAWDSRCISTVHIAVNEFN